MESNLLQEIELIEKWITNELELLENHDYMTTKEQLITILSHLNDIKLSQMFTSATLLHQAVKEQAKQIENYVNTMNLATGFLQSRNLEGDMLQWLIDNKIITTE